MYSAVEPVEPRQGTSGRFAIDSPQVEDGLGAESLPFQFPNIMHFLAPELVSVLPPTRVGAGFGTSLVSCL